MSVWCSHVFGHRVSGIWGRGVFSVCCRVFYCCHRVCHRVPSDWPQTRATGSAAHPPSTQSDGNGKPVCIHLLPASFVCAVKTIFLLRTSDKKCKKKWDLESNRFVEFCDLADSFCRLVGASGLGGHPIWRRHSKMCIIYFVTLPGGGGGGDSAGPRTPTTPAPPPPLLGAFSQRLVAKGVALRRPWAAKVPDAP